VERLVAEDERDIADDALTRGRRDQEKNGDIERRVARELLASDDALSGAGSWWSARGLWILIALMVIVAFVLLRYTWQSPRHR
jgi:hypothetical protein